MRFIPSPTPAMTLSPGMLCSVKILQMSTLELERFIREVALENPLIDPDFASAEEIPSVFPRVRAYGNLRDDEGDDSDEGDFSPCERNAGETLRDDLYCQLSGLRTDPERERLVRLMIDSLDERGYLPGNADPAEWGVGESEFVAALSVLQSLDPPGTGARNLRECLSLQAGRLENPPPFLFEIIEKHLDLLAANRPDLLALKLRVSSEEIKELRETLLSLNPHPGNGYFSSVPVPYVVPDVFVRRCGEDFEVACNERGEPRIAFDGYYRRLAGSGEDAEASAWLRERLKEAEWTISCIRQRLETIEKCASAIVRRQRLFFELGPGNLAPLSLSDLGNELGIHVSTVSRSTCGKYLQCRWGIFELASFFSRSLNGKGTREGKAISQDSVKARVARIVAGEDSTRPLSDGEIARSLNRCGVALARRTVTKYREQLGIPAAALRKKF